MYDSERVHVLQREQQLDDPTHHDLLRQRLASRVDAPHQRREVAALAVRHDYQEFSPPRPLVDATRGARSRER